MAVYYGAASCIIAVHWSQSIICSLPPPPNPNPIPPYVAAGPAAGGLIAFTTKRETKIRSLQIVKYKIHTYYNIII